MEGETEPCEHPGQEHPGGRNRKWKARGRNRMLEKQQGHCGWSGVRGRVEGGQERGLANFKNESEFHSACEGKPLETSYNLPSKKLGGVL